MSLALNAALETGSDAHLSPLRPAIQVMLWGLDGSAMQ